MICALRLSQVDVLKGKQTVLLVDDLASELDVSARERLLGYLVQSKAQVFISSIEESSVLPALQRMNQDYKVFHVEHGTIKES